MPAPDVRNNLPHARKSFTEAPWASLSFEATGTRAGDARVLEMGIASYRGQVPRSTWCRRFHPGIEVRDGKLGVFIPQPTTGLNGIDEPAVRDCPPFGVSAEVAALLGVSALVTYRGDQFSLPVLRRELAKKGVYPRLPPHVDLYSVVQWHQRHLRGNRLDEVAARWEVPTRRRGDQHPHPAGADASTCGELLVRLVQAGLVPADIEEAAAQSERYAHELRAEQEVWGPWVYRDRQDPQLLRLGCSKKDQGTPLDALDEGFIQWIFAGGLDAPPPEDVQQLLRSRLQRWGPRGIKDKGQWDRQGPCPYRSPGQARVQALIDGAPAACPGCASLRAQNEQLRTAPPPDELAVSMDVALENARLQTLLTAHPMEALYSRLAEILPHLPHPLVKEVLHASCRRMQLLDQDDPPPPLTQAQEDVIAAVWRARAQEQMHRDFERYQQLFARGGGPGGRVPA